jgi:hypothetical protein
MRGWAFAYERQEPVLVQAVLNHEILGEAIANLPRPDLKAAGLGDGKSGYVIELFRPVDPLYWPFLVVKVDGGDVELPRAPMLGFGEFFASLYFSHPASGRSRSVFGGLWTDRTDAAALLRGKAAIGQIGPEINMSLAHLIHDGYAVLNLRQAPVEHAWRDRLPEQAGEVTEDPALLPLLRGVLEDNPLIVKADWVRNDADGLAQPSAGSPSPSPAECVEVILPFGESVALDVVRDSHRLPEFTPYGVSRWASHTATDSMRLAQQHGLLDCVALVPGKAVVVGPGTLCRVRAESGAAAVRLLCLPERGLPVALGSDKGRQESVRLSRGRVWV